MAFTLDPRVKYGLLAALIFTSIALNWSAQQSLDYFNKGMELGMAGDAQGAEEAFTQAIAADPAFAEAYANRGALRGQRGDYEASRADLEKAVELKPSLGYGWFNLGRARFRLGDYQGAGEAFDYAHQIDPTTFPDAAAQIQAMAGAQG